MNRLFALCFAIIRHRSSQNAWWVINKPLSPLSTSSQVFELVNYRLEQIANMILLSLFLIASFSKTALCQTIAQEISALPSCSLTCLSNAIASAGCGHTDYACQCGSAKGIIQNTAATCLYNVCSPSDVSSKSLRNPVTDGSRSETDSPKLSLASLSKYVKFKIQVLLHRTLGRRPVQHQT